MPSGLPTTRSGSVTEREGSRDAIVPLQEVRVFHRPHPSPKTDVVSELRKAKARKADRNVAAWAFGVPAGARFVSVVTSLALKSHS
jgi:hypothetical protein